MKSFKQFLSESTYQIIDPKGKPFSTAGSYEDAVDELKGMGEDPKTSKYKIKKGEKVLDWSMKESLSESEYEVEVAVRDARKANAIAKDMFRGTYEQDGSNSFIFKKESDLEDFKNELEAQRIEVI